MKIRERLLNLKKRLSDRHMYSIVIAIIGVVAIWGLYQYKQEMEFRQKAENQYNRSFYEMVGYVQNVEVMLSKAMIANSPELGVTNLSEVWRQANLAQANLSQLPISHLALDNTSKFLTQVSDFSYSLVRQNLAGKPITQEQFDNMKGLHDYATRMEENLFRLQADLGNDRIRWGELSRKGTPIFQQTSDNFTRTQFENLEKEFKEYPSLIYDGPFSDGLKDMKPLGLTGDTISEDRARDLAVKFIGADRVQEINSIGTTDGDFKTYNFQATLNGAPRDTSTVINITEKGGHALLMTNNRAAGPETVNINQAKDTARRFLEDRGFNNMVDTYYINEDGSATINFAYSQDNVVIYPDLIKVKVALDNGEVIGFESSSYFTSHRDRTIPEPKVGEEEARKAINPRLNVYSSGLAIIPTEWKTEVLTHEFKGKVDDRDFLVYVNAETGKEERILLIIDAPNGVLTM